MKPCYLFIIAAAAWLPSCASKPQQRVVTVSPHDTGRVLNRGEAASVRHSEVIKAYPVGRYTEPRRRGLMHEAHTVYRVEKAPRWNFTRLAGTTAAALAAPPPPRTTALPSAGEMAVELNRQRQATQAVIQSGHAVSDKLADMTAALQQNRVLAEQNAAVRQELEATRLRLEALEQEVQARPQTAPGDALHEEPW